MACSFAWSRINFGLRDTLAGYITPLVHGMEWLRFSSGKASNHGIAFRPATQSKPGPCMRTPQMPCISLPSTVFEVLQQLSEARQPRYNSRASGFSLCDSHERCFCVWFRELACVRVCHCRILYKSRNHEQSQEHRCHSAFFFIFHF